ncbi:hypothetical protein A3B57_00130 [Microgenomates group bacterium RIFCSPLOWO2_01_FULL_47_10]|nr:MAG: hypothetical protein A3B57_00130 [Microgenomates group bacterium RIFCSPLOWO2_01_FULL_47_10]
MPKDKYSAVWVSHSSLSDFIKCPRAYFLKNVYKDPHTGHKISLMSPPLALGQAVHEVIESLSILPVEKRFAESLLLKFQAAFKKVSGIKGGFAGGQEEEHLRKKGEEMIRRVMKHPGPLANLAVKIAMDLPYYYLSEEDNIILCGKIDWLEYLPKEDGVHIIDFKTGKSDEQADSLQLPIYNLLVTNTQHRKVIKASYWYLERSDDLSPKELPDLTEAKQRVLTIAKQVSLARKLNRFPCPTGGCRECKPLEAVVAGNATKVEVNDYKHDVYVLTKSGKTNNKDSAIL